MESIMLYNNCNEDTVPELSIVIPTYKRARYLEDSINSIVNQIANRVAYEIIVVNNDPNDNMEELIDRYKNHNIAFYKNKQNLGQVGNVNQGAVLSRGKYIAYLHDDDILLPDYLSKMEPYIKHGEYNCILPEFYDFYQRYIFEWKHVLLRNLSFFSVLYRKKIQKIDPDAHLKCFHDIYGMPTCGVAFLRKSLIEYGLFKDERGAAWDYYNFRNFNKNYDIFILHECLGARRCYSGMTNTDKVQKEFDADTKQLFDENQGQEIVKIFGRSIITKKPLIKFALYRIYQDAYIYINNLERRRPISRTQFAVLKDKVTLE
jgi:glycosyltransferase involved in cell wall biosynthesis